LPEERIREQRVATLDALGLLSTTDDTRFDRVLAMLSEFFQLPRAAIVVAHRDTLIVKSSLGLGITPSKMSGSFTERVMASHTTFVIEDAAADPRFAASPMVTGEPFIRAYIGQPLRAGGQVIGSFAMAGPEPRIFGEVEQEHFRRAAGWIEEELARETELVRAAEVQKSLLPKTAPSVDGYEIAGASTPSRSVGGDFYDWYEVPDGLGFTLADVMGKGVGAAIVAATVRAVIRTSAPDSGTVATVTRAPSTRRGPQRYRLLRHPVHASSGSGRPRAVRRRGPRPDPRHPIRRHLHRLAHETFRLAPRSIALHRHTVWLGVGDTLLSFSDGVLDLFDGTVASLADVVAMVVYAAPSRRSLRALTRMAELDTTPTTSWSSASAAQLREPPDHCEAHGSSDRGARSELRRLRWLVSLNWDAWWIALP
jgi:hypothetical protein